MRGKVRWSEGEMRWDEEEGEGSEGKVRRQKVKQR